MIARAGPLGPKFDCAVAAPARGNRMEREEELRELIRKLDRQGLEPDRLKKRAEELLSKPSTQKDQTKRGARSRRKGVHSP
jgi:hypothetical protein